MAAWRSPRDPRPGVPLMRMGALFLGRSIARYVSWPTDQRRGL